MENPELLSKIQTELAEVIRPMQDKPKLTVDPAHLRERCPLLASTSNEVLRYVGSSTSTMVVQEDVWIDDDRYLLTKGAWVQISAMAVHSDPDTWGPDAGSFNPERFLKGLKVHPSANRTFGGGSTLCPGRHLATDEILVLTAMLLHTFDVEFAPGSRLPRRDEFNMLPIMRPSKEAALRLRRRPGMEDVSWGFDKGQRV